ncbi:MAG: lipocalin-like domain-containing protein [Nannocystales bacterium]
MALRPEDLVGTWELEVFEVELADGRRVFPMGADARGSLMYTEDGRMSATLSAAERAPLSVPRLEAFARAPSSEKAAAFDSYLAYVGRYTVEPGAVVHHVELASVPNIVGANQRRDATLEADHLTLRYAVDGDRGSRHNTLRWRRS